jgi:hypothetical protein
MLIAVHTTVDLAYPSERNHGEELGRSLLFLFTQNFRMLSKIFSYTSVVLS